MATPMKFLGGIPCLDFVNTVGGWRSGRVLEDKLETYADLIRWAELAGLESSGPEESRRARPREFSSGRARCALRSIVC